MASGPNVNWCIVLKEYADAENVSYHYDDMGSSGPLHNPTFHWRANLGTFTAEGTGKTKRAAKAQAAQLLMELIKPGGENPQSDIATRMGNLHARANFVGELQELCQLRKWPLPVYKEEVCQEHTFLCKINVPMEEFNGSVRIHAKGSGKTKRDAKGRAAENVLGLTKLLTTPIADEPQRVVEILV